MMPSNNRFTTTCDPHCGCSALANRSVVLAKLASFKSRGLTDADILEVLVNVVLNIFTNYTNHIAATEIDFPVVVLKKAA